MLKNDKEAHGVGMQNFKWLSGYHEFVTIIRFHSPSAYWSLAQYLPAPTERGYRYVIINDIQLTCPHAHTDTSGKIDLP